MYNRQRWKLGWNPEKWLELKFWLSGKAAKELLQGGCEPHSKRSRLWIYNLTNKSYLHPYHSLIKTCFWRLSQFIFPSLKKEEIAVDFKADAYKAYMHSIHIMHFENMTELDNVRAGLLDGLVAEIIVCFLKPKLHRKTVCCLLSWSQFVENVCWLKVDKFALLSPPLLIFPKNLNLTLFPLHRSYLAAGILLADP